MITGLYVDGGVIGMNPSLIAGTYAWRLVYDDDREPIGQGKVITVAQMGMPEVTNNQTEMLALLRGLQRLPDHWIGTIYSDSMVTLGRAFQGFKWKNVPSWMHRLYRSERKRLINWDQIKYVQLDGHPSKAHLRAGIGKRGHPVSEHNVWCDKACQQAAAEFMDKVGQNIPTALDFPDALIGVDFAKPGSEFTVRTDLGVPGSQLELTFVPVPAE